MIRCIRDPEYLYNLSQLRVVSPREIHVSDEAKIITVRFTPTMPNCSLSSIIGLSIRIKLMCDFMVDSDWKLVTLVTPGSHLTETELNKQLNDKERIAAAMDNPSVMDLVNSCVQY